MSSGALVAYKPEVTGVTEIVGKVSCEDFDVSRLVLSDLIKKTYTTPDGTGDYQQIDIRYKYSDGVDRKLMIELPEVKCDGIRSNDKWKAKQVKLFIDEKQDWGKTVVKCITDIQNALVEKILPIKGQCGLRNMQKSIPFLTGFKDYIYRPSDKKTGDRIEGRNPSLFVKLDQSYNRTTFTAINEQVLPWDTLKGVNMLLVPMLHVSHLYIGGGKAAVQIKLASATVISVEEASNAAMQKDTIAKYSSDAEAIAKLEAQLAALKAKAGSGPPKVLNEISPDKKSSTDLVNDILKSGEGEEQVETIQ